MPTQQSVGRALMPALLLLIPFSAALAADPAPAPQQAKPATTVPADELRSAYQKEYAFLAAQKKELIQRLAALNEETRRSVEETEARIARLQDEVLGLEVRSQQAQERAADIERRRLDAQRSADLLKATFQQASVAFEQHRPAVLQSAAFKSADESARLQTVFTEGVAILGDLQSVRQYEGEFYTDGGGQVQGRIVRYGDVASFGVADQAAGILVPAGGGALKLWREPHADVARALAAGKSPETLPLFLFGRRDGPVDTGEGKGPVEYIDSGGIIAWLIVVLGAVGLLLAIARGLFLRRAGATAETIVHEITDMVRERRLADAIEVCKKHKGSAAAVVATALRNLERDRESLEDIINESILHENEHLDRFGTMIFVVAAVAPLLGLLGTVTGMIATFDIITTHGTGDPKLLSSGISVALITTELGLEVAIPSLLVGNLLGGWADRIKDGMEKAALRIINLYDRVATPDQDTAV